MAKVIMVQGTTSNAGKSLLTAGLCRVFQKDGYRVAPFKSQNMALNSFITKDGLEMGRAQVMQAEAAGQEPSVLMNPILLKPNSDRGSQVIVNGEVVGNMSAVEYFKYRITLVPDICKAYLQLAAQNDIIVIEGAGSPAEINLKSGDIVNMGMAKLAQAPVLLVGDIDRGGVFASLYGTVALLDEDEKAMIKGTVINKFRGDLEILKPGLSMLEDLTKVPVLGVLPYLSLDLDDEDSLSERLNRKTAGSVIDIAAIRLPHLSNFTDFNVFEQIEGVGVRYVSRAKDLKQPDLILLPGTKNTMADLLWMRQCGLESAVIKANRAGIPVFGICGGYQMLGESLTDLDGLEQGGTIKGMCLLPLQTVFEKQKIRKRVRGTVQQVGGVLSAMSGAAVEGYEIHMGRSIRTGDGQDLTQIHLLGHADVSPDGCYSGNVYGSYVHGFFDSEAVVKAVAGSLFAAKGLQMSEISGIDTIAYKEQQYDKLADAVRQNLDMKQIYQILEAGLSA